MDHAVASELLGAYALDACEDAECEAVDAHLTECEACAVEAARLKDLAGWIGVSEAITPDRSLRQRILRRAADDVPLP